MLAEETLAMRADGERFSVHLAAVEGIGRSLEGPRRAIYLVAHTARFAEDVTATCPLARAELVRTFLAEALGLTPRQSEGPWNIVGLSVSPATLDPLTT